MHTHYPGILMPLRREPTDYIHSPYRIFPYWHEEQWVFDDPTVGLVKEPFIKGSSEMITAMLERNGLTNAKAGFELRFHSTGTSHFRLHREEEENSGWWYYCPQLDMRGWLCPALYMYFKEAPQVLKCLLSEQDFRYAVSSIDNAHAPGAVKSTSPCI